MIRFSLFLALLIVAPIGATAQIPEIQRTAYQLRTMAPAELGNLLFGEKSPPFTDKWIEGPTRDWTSLSVDLAATPASTGYDGLCRVVTGTAYFIWPPGSSRGEDDPLDLGMTPRSETLFFLTHDAADLSAIAVDASGPCAKQRPLQPFPSFRRLIGVWHSTDGAGFESGSVDAVRFGVRAFIAGRKAAQTMSVAVERCGTGFVNVPASCGDPGAFVRSIYLRQIAAIVVMQCSGSMKLCVDVTVEGLGGTGTDHIVLATADSRLGESGEKLPTIDSIAVRAGGDPVT